MCLLCHCANFTVTFAYLTTQELYVTIACLIHHSSHRFRTQSLVTLRHSNIGLRRVFRHCLFCVLSVFLVAAVAAVQFFSGPATFISPCCQLPLHLFAPVAFCNQACSALQTATTVRSRPSLTHPLTLPAITYFAPRRLITTRSHHSTCDQQRWSVSFATATVAACHVLFSIPLSLPSYNRHCRSLDPFLTHNFSARRYSHYIMQHYFYFPVYFND